MIPIKLKVKHFENSLNLHPKDLFINGRDCPIARAARDHFFITDKRKVIEGFDSILVENKEYCHREYGCVEFLVDYKEAQENIHDPEHVVNIIVLY